MKSVVAIVVPMVLQVLFVAAIVAVTNGTGSFVGLGAILVGLVAIPITALLNWQAVRIAGSGSAPVVRLVAVSMVFPVVILVLYATAS
jgi:hypothetical protein